MCGWEICQKEEAVLRKVDWIDSNVELAKWKRRFGETLFNNDSIIVEYGIKYMESRWIDLYKIFFKKLSKFWGS